MIEKLDIILIYLFEHINIASQIIRGRYGECSACSAGGQDRGKMPCFHLGLGRPDRGKVHCFHLGPTYILLAVRKFKQYRK
jgi:hypothetical protein